LFIKTLVWIRICIETNDDPPHCRQPRLKPILDEKDLPLPEEEPAGLLERLVPLLVPEDGDPDLLVGHHDGLVDEALAVLLHLGEDLVGGHLAARHARLARHGQRVDQGLDNFSDQMCRSVKYFQPISMIKYPYPELRSHLLYLLFFIYSAS
jgi:hypothetical protein